MEVGGLFVFAPSYFDEGKGNKTMYRPQWMGRKTQILAMAGVVADAYPHAWARAKTGHDDGEYIRRVAYACHVDISLEIGINYKRGEDGVLSNDVLAFPNPTGCRDDGGTFAGLELVDIIIDHELPSARLGWGDVTQATIDARVPGQWVKPVPVVGGGAVPPPHPPTVKPCADPRAHDAKPLPHYPGDHVGSEIGAALFADYAEAGHPPDGGMSIWIFRTAWDAAHGLAMADSIAKHRQEWRAALGLR